MKKYNLLKVLAITVFVSWLLTLIVPGSYVDYTGNITTSDIAGLGIWGLLSNLSISISYFNSIAVFLIAVACFYAVLNKIEIYKAFVNKTTKIFEGKEKLLFIIVTLVFGILSIFISDFLVLIVFAPFVYTVMKELKIDNKKILSSTLVASLIGSMCGIYNGTLFNTFSLDLNTLLLVKVILFVVSTIVLILLTAPKKEVKAKKVVKTTKKVNKKVTKEEIKKEVKKAVTNLKSKKVNKVVYLILTILFGSIGINKFYAGKIKEGILRLVFCWTLIPLVLSVAEFITVLTEKADKKGQIPSSSQRRQNVNFAVLLVIFTLFIIGTIIPWESIISNFTLFTKINTKIAQLKIGNYAIFGNIIGLPSHVDSTTGATKGVINVFGSWTMSDVSIFLFILTFIIFIGSNIKINEFIEAENSAIKKVLPVAITAMLISIVLVIMVTTGINITLVNLILSITKGFNIALTSFATVIGSLLTGNLYYFLATLGPVFLSHITNRDYYGVVAFILQSLYNLVMMIAPVSVGLIIGLYYLDIPYNKWFKFIWKTLVILLVIIIITSIVIYVLV